MEEGEQQRKKLHPDSQHGTSEAPGLRRLITNPRTCFGDILQLGGLPYNAELSSALTVRNSNLQLCI